jgi:hypothetical protein
MPLLHEGVFMFRVDGAVKVQYLRYTQFLGISRTDKYAVFFEIAQALILNFLRRHLKIDFLRKHQSSTFKVPHVVSLTLDLEP